MSSRNPTLNTGITGKAFYFAKDPANATGTSDAFDTASKQAPDSAVVERTASGLMKDGVATPASALPKRSTKYDNNNVITNYGAAQPVGNKRLNGSIPFKKPTQMLRASTTKREYELVDANNPFAFRVVGETVHTQLYPEKLDRTNAIVVKGAAPNVRGIQITTDETTTAPPITDYCRSISVQENGLELVVGATFVQSVPAEYSVTFTASNGADLDPTGVTDITNGQAEAFTFVAADLTGAGYAQGVMPITITVSDGVSTGKTTAVVKDPSILGTASVQLSFEGTPNITVGGRTAALTTAINGFPPLKLFVDWGAGGADQPFFEEIAATASTTTRTTFSGATHTYATPGTYYVRIVAEQIVGGDRQQITTVQSVVVT